MSYTTWMDFSRRMLGSEVSEEDWRQFVTLYQGFIIGYCKKKFVNHKDPAGSLSEDKIFEVENVTGNIDTNFEGKAKAAADALLLQNRPEWHPPAWV